MEEPETLLLASRDVRALLPMGECIGVMEAALRSVTDGSSVLPLRTVIRLDGTLNAFAAMPAVVGKGAGASLGAKIITVFPGQRRDAVRLAHRRGAPVRCRARHAARDRGRVVDYRRSGPSAVSGLATRLLAREDAHELALLGAGVLAMPHLEAIRCVRDMRRVRVWSRSGERAKRLRGARAEADRTSRSSWQAARVRRWRAPMWSARSPGRARPCSRARGSRPASHVNAVGASLPVARELDTAAVARSRLFVDRRESTLNEAGDFRFARDEGAITDAHILGELGELLAGTVRGRTGAGDVTLFKSLGLAVEDVAALRHIHAKALATGAGTRVALGGLRDE